VPTLGGPHLYGAPAGTRDQRAIERRPDVLAFSGAPLARPLEVTGQLTFRPPPPAWLGVVVNKLKRLFFSRSCLPAVIIPTTQGKLQVSA
jgi:hypothetical protein